mmetsp:Transcript_65349/g.202594  ORF Transcript_65349/g.202594 Transcript_65349/m.202594 type:complete len:233 (-) Transcript_65349:346-1044(-)
MAPNGLRACKLEFTSVRPQACGWHWQWGPGWRAEAGPARGVREALRRCRAGGCVRCAHGGRRTSGRQPRSRGGSACALEGRGCLEVRVFPRRGSVGVVGSRERLVRGLQLVGGEQLRRSVGAGQGGSRSAFHGGCACLDSCLQPLCLRLRLRLRFRSGLVDRFVVRPSAVSLWRSFVPCLASSCLSWAVMALATRGCSPPAALPFNSFARADALAALVHLHMAHRTCPVRKP